MNDEIDQLEVQAEQLGYCAESIALLERAVRLADESQDLDLAFRTRLTFISHTNFGGQSEKTVVAMLWCLGQFDKDPERFKYHSYDLCWRTKWLLLGFTRFPNVSRKQFDDIYQRFLQLWQQVGYDPRPLHNIYSFYGLECGDSDLARHYFDLYERGTEDELADCYACTIDNEVEYFVGIGDFEQAIKRVQPILDGEVACAEVPHRTLGTILRPLTLLGREEEALEYHKRGAILLRNNLALLRYIGRHLEFAAHLGEFPRGLRLIERHLLGAMESVTLDSVFHFYLGAMVLFEKLAAKRKTVKLKFPSQFPAYSAEGVYDPAVIRDWFTSEVNRIAALFDARNGNNRYSKDLVAAARY